MRRNIAASLRRELDRQESGEALLVFLTISSPEIPDVIRVVSDAKDYVWQGETYIGFWFDATLLTDTEGPPEAKLTVQNVDQVIGEYVRKITKPPRLRLDVIPASEFDQTVTPRTEKAFVAEFDAEFLGSDESFTTNVATLTAGLDGAVFDQTGADPMLISPTISIVGSEETLIRLDIERVTARSGGSWQGTCFYATDGGHSYSASFNKAFDDLDVGERKIIDLDMSDLSVGGDDWVDSTITKVRFDFDNGLGGGKFLIRRVAIGHTDATPIYTADHLYLIDVSANVSQVMGTIASWNYTQRSWPGRRANKSRCPALFH